MRVRADQSAVLLGVSVEALHSVLQRLEARRLIVIEKLRRRLQVGLTIDLRVAAVTGRRDTAILDLALAAAVGSRVSQGRPRSLPSSFLHPAHAARWISLYGPAGR